MSCKLKTFATNIKPRTHVALEINWCVDKKVSGTKLLEKEKGRQRQKKKEDKGEKVGKKSVRKKASPFQWIEVRGGG